MPPPSTSLSRFRHRVSLYQHHTRSWATLNQQSFQLALRLLIFAAKVATITKPCWPVATRETVWWPLTSLAALELALGNKLRWKLTLMFAVAHTLVLTWVLLFSGAGLCMVERKGVLVADDWNVEG